MKGPVNRAEADVYELWVTGQALEALDARAEAIQLYNRAAFHRGADDRNFVPETPLNVLRAEAERNPGDARTMVPLIRALYDIGQREEAYAQARRLQAANMGAVDAHLLAADTAMGVRNYGAALNALGDARRLRFTEPVMLRVVEAYRALGQRDAAARIVTDFLRYNPASVEGLRWMAVNYLEAGKADWALAILQKLKRRVGDHDALLLALLAEAQLGVGEHNAAAATARHAYRLQPSSPAVTYIYGLTLLEQKDRRGDALDLLEKAATLVPGNAVFQSAYARAAKKVG
jgi:predicted Zn-dependent protease